MTKTSKRYQIISASFALIMWGGWAFYVNGEDGQAKQMISALVQGTASFTMTLLMVKAITFLYCKCQMSPMRYVLPTVITVGCTGVFVSSAHYLAGTPHIIQTIAPALTMGFLFSLYTTGKLVKSEASLF